MTTKTTINVSPKVLTGLLTGLGTAALLGVANAVDSHTFDFLGPWSAVAYPAFTILVAQGAAWLKREHDASIKTDLTAQVSGYLGGLATASSITPAPVEPLVPHTVDQIIAPTNDPTPSNPA